MSKLGLEFNKNDNNFQLGVCKFDKTMRQTLYNNPHCIEYFCVFDNCKNCSDCYKYLYYKYNNNYDRIEKDTMITNEEKNILLQLSSSKEECMKACNDGFLYGIKLTPHDKEYANHFIDAVKGIANKKNFKKSKLIESVWDVIKIIKNLDPKGTLIPYESTYPKPTTVIKWGQLKLFLEVLFFFNKVIDKNDMEVHVVYAGSAPGTSLITLCKLFPCLRLYLIDPREQARGLIGHPQVVEIRTQFFTNETAEYYFKKMENIKKNHKVLFMSDIRMYTDDINIVKDNMIQAEWHNIIKPLYSYLKFRCPWVADNDTIKYFDAEYYFQPFAPVHSTETRVLVPTNCKMRDINIREYEQICFFHNRILRPSYYECGINHLYIDRCYDCTFFYQIMKEYNIKFPQFFKNKNIKNILHYTVTTFENTRNKLHALTESHKKNIIL
jgi:hypothetical protein